MKALTITINLDKKCKKCGKKGASTCGLCLNCAMDKILSKTSRK